MFATHHNTWASKTTLREHAGSGTHRVGYNECEIVGEVFNANVCNVSAETQW
jgi:hypothetical protein